MWLQRLQARGLRCFRACEVNFAPGINVLYGNNGAGKTSILEGISVLSSGKSFRTTKLAHIIHEHLDELVLLGEVNNQNDIVQLGVQNKSGHTNLRVNREKAAKWSELAKNLPVLEIHPESYLLITGGPVERRKFLNWGMFHVKPSYGSIWSEYSRALKQRNSCLRHREIGQAKYWHQSLAEHGNQIATCLDNYTENIIPYIHEISNQFGLTDELSVRYYPGWDQDHDLHKLLEQELTLEEIGLSTLHGPHRGDMRITWKKKPFAKISSRGQQKVLAIALKIAQAKYMQEQYSKTCVYLIDELPAELDNRRREIALDLLSQLNAQVIISAVSKHSVDYINNDIKWFHVEPSCVAAMV